MIFRLFYKYFEFVRYRDLKKKYHFKEKSISALGTKITYFEREGEKGKIIFLHGLLDASFTFRKIVEELEGFHIYLFDLPGFGKSDFPKLNLHRHIDSFAELLLHCFRRLKIKSAILVGHSMGGLISQHIAVIEEGMPNNDRIIKSLVLIAPGGIMHPNRDEMRALLFPKNTTELERLLKALYYNEKEPPSHFISRALLEVWNSEKYEILAENTIKREEKVFLGKKAGKIKLPVLILAGSDDPIIDLKMAKKMIGFFKNKKSSLKVIENTRHALHLEKPKEVVKEIVEFIKVS